MKLCQIYNFASSYRESIYKLIGNSFDTDWFFGSTLSDIKSMDTRKLRGKVTIVKNINLLNGKAYWQTNIIKQLFKKEYTHYLLLGDERCLSTWLFLICSIFYPQKKIYFWSHGQYGKESFFKKIIEKFFWHFNDGAFLYGNYAKSIMIKNGFNAEKLHVIHNSLAYDYQLSLRSSNLTSSIYKEHFKNNHHTLIFIGRLTKVKKLDQILSAVSLLKKKGENYNIVFIGDGIEKDYLEQFTEKLNIKDQVWFYGACYDEQTNAKLVYNADICVAPGNVGLTAVHTLMFGCPVITHNDFPWQMPEFEAIHDGITGSFFERDNVESLAGAISKWFREKSSKREVVRRACYNEIDTQWNPYFQMNVIKSVIK